MTCTDFLAKLTDYFDGRVEPELLAEVEHHISECHHCEVVLDSTTHTINFYRDNEIYDFPPELETRLHSAIMHRCCRAGQVAMSIATKHGDAGMTALAGGHRLSKGELKVESYGTVDELNTTLGFARSICTQTDIASWTEEIQRTLFRVGAALSTPAAALKVKTYVSDEDVERLTSLVVEIEATDGILADWSLPGANTQSAAFEMARTVCRRG